MEFNHSLNSPTAPFTANISYPTGDVAHVLTTLAHRASIASSIGLDDASSDCSSLTSGPSSPAQVSPKLYETRAASDRKRLMMSDNEERKRRKSSSLADDDDFEYAPARTATRKGRNQNQARGRRGSAAITDCNNQRLFVCSYPDCGRVFKRSEHLKRHNRSIHTDDKPAESVSHAQTTSTSTFAFMDTDMIAITTGMCAKV
ncbi:hypothetical protein BZG36_04419 [Bifiguratus adelaidae]|uniref:C2H2-type domain-containing protein n=1 Tax=Bifiguratus adelaidae TaxID=1938954 RepID=A0A261XWS1_9FUNG|nr:hypothetical protein BZG36_04419 [Bifiguratus adelaidae]